MGLHISDDLSPYTDRSELVARYIKLYSMSYTSNPVEESYDPHRLSFLAQNLSSSTTVVKIKDPSLKDSALNSQNVSPGTSEDARRVAESNNEDQKTPHENETKLLDLVRVHTRNQETKPEPKVEPQTPEEPSEDDIRSEIYIPSFGMRMTDRSISRASRASRISTRRDVDIPSLLAFTPSHDPAPVTSCIPAFKIAEKPEQEDVPKWSIRRSVCPVCSQKWKDRSAINNIKCSGLKRNTALDMPSIRAPARLRTAITHGYLDFNRSNKTIADDKGLGLRGFRNTGTAWQLTRARLYRAPKPKSPPPEAKILPGESTKLSRKDLDSRVSKFLKE